MAGFAPESCAIRPLLLHAIFELVLVGILVTHRAGTVFEAVDHGILGFRRGSLLMAVSARCRDVSARKLEPCLFVLG